MSRHEPLVESLRERFGGALRSVAVGTLGAECLVLHERHDVSCHTAAFHDLLLESIYADGQERLHCSGSLNAVVRVFEDAHVVTVFGPESDGGTFLSFDADTGVNPIDAVDLCREHRSRLEPPKSG